MVARNGIMSDTNSDDKIQNLKLSTMLAGEISIEEILNDREKSVDPDTELIEKKSVIKKREQEQRKSKRLEQLKELAKKYGMLKNENKSSNIKGSVMLEKDNQSEKKSTSTALVEVQSKDSEHLLSDLKQAKLSSMNLLDSSAKELNSVLTELCKKKENGDYQKMDITAIESVVKIAGGIENLIRAKTDAMRGMADVLKAVKEIKEMEKN